MNTVVIIDYGSGNLHSAAKAFERAARDATIETSIRVTSYPDMVRKADRIVLPGVGAFRDCRNGLKAVPGMWETLEEEVRAKGKPIFGICVGMQLMASRGLEYGTTEGFDWIPGDIKQIEPKDKSLKIPHMGWNTLTIEQKHPLLNGVPPGLHAYFVHSYHLATDDPTHVVATADYAGPVTALVGCDNIAGTQFHPEKSQTLGLAVIANFLRWRP